jgi:NADH:ubiquinone oxidoreductase subunit F (NADH-binding)
VFDLNDIKCCDSCWHSPEKPCHDFIECLNSEPLCQGHSNCADTLKKKFSIYRNEAIQKLVIFIGYATCGMESGAEKTKQAIKRYLDGKKIECLVIEVGCNGMCFNEPIVEIQVPGKTRISFKNITEDKVNDLFAHFFNGNLPLEYIIGQHRNNHFESYMNVPFLDELAFFNLQKRLVLDNCGIISPENIEEYIAANGFKALSKALKTLMQSDLCDIVEHSGLRDRDGTGKKTGEKWKYFLKNEKKDNILICNANESDPYSFMNRAIIESDPYRLIEAIIIASYSIGANKAYIYLNAKHSQVIQRLEKGVENCRKIGLIGNNILDSGFSLEIEIEKSKSSTSGIEETSLSKKLDFKPFFHGWMSSFSKDKGPFGNSTLVCNVETLANIPQIIEKGPDWFNKVGTKSSKGTKVLALSGDIINTALIEVEFGTKLNEIIYDIAGGIQNDTKLKAVQIGGPFGGSIPEQKLDTEIDYELIQEIGVKMVSGGIIAFNEDTCMVESALNNIDFMQKENCGNCIPCREGTKRLYEILKRITNDSSEGISINSLERFQSVLHINNLIETMQNASLCDFGKMAPNTVLNTLRWFRDEYEVHVYDRTCIAKEKKRKLI